MSNAASDRTAREIWGCLNKEITGVQLLWAAARHLFFSESSEGPASLLERAPLLSGLVQTALLESLLMRVARLMDPATSGRGQGEKPNLSLKRLVNGDARLSAYVAPVIELWNGSGLKDVRSQYLSHNDLVRSRTQSHTLSIPLGSADITALEVLVNALREMQRSVHKKITDASWLDGTLDVNASREVAGLISSLQAADVFFELLPEHDALQRAWHGRPS